MEHEHLLQRMLGRAGCEPEEYRASWDERSETFYIRPAKTRGYILSITLELLEDAANGEAGRTHQFSRSVADWKRTR
jgi:hypothetical protein